MEAVEPSHPPRKVCMYIKGVLNERVSQTSASAVVTRSQPPKPASLRDAGFAAPLWQCWNRLLLARVWRVALFGFLID